VKLRLYAILFAIVLAMVPIVADASTVYMNVFLSNDSPTGGHVKVRINFYGVIPASDAYSYSTASLSGFVDQGDTVQVSSGIMSNNTGVRTYMFIGNGAAGSWGCGPGAVISPNFTGCIQYILGLTTGTPEEILLEDDYNATLHEWIFWSQDEQATWREIGWYSTTSNYFNAPQLQAAITYASILDPFYILDAEFIDPMIYFPGLTLAQHWAVPTSAVAAVSGTNPLDALDCPTLYGIIPNPANPHSFRAGTTGPEYASAAICNGALWPIISSAHTVGVQSKK
jgi:hypothetical protein